MEQSILVTKFKDTMQYKNNLLLYFSNLFYTK